MYRCLVCVFAALTVIQVQGLDTDDHDWKQRLTVLETAVLRLTERNKKLEERYSNIEKRNEDLIEKNQYLIKSNSRLEKRNSNFEKRFSSLEIEIKYFKNTIHRFCKESCCQVYQKDKNREQEETPSMPETHSTLKMKTDAPQNQEAHSKRQSNTKTVATVAFTAVVHPMDLQNLGAGQTVIYDNVITNVGDAYHNYTGIFTALLNGVYVFNFAEMILPGRYEYLELVKNGQHVMWNFGHGLDAPHITSSSRTTTLELKAGDEVWVRTSPTSNHGTGEIHGNDYSTFSGWIVHIA